MNIFLNNAPSLWEHGLPVMPLAGKRPLLKQWTRYCDQMPDEASRAEWLSLFPDHNIGLPLGPASGITVIDIDTDDLELQSAILNVLPPSPWHRIGKKGLALAFRWTGVRNFKIRSDKGMLCELLGVGNQVVLPPSIHPETGKVYVANADLGMVLDQLETLPFDVEHRLIQALSSAGANLGQSTARVRKAARVARGKETSRFDWWIERTLDAAKVKIASKTEGNRNDTLSRVAGNVARDVAAAGLSWAPWAEHLAAAARDVGLETREIEGTLGSAWRFGLAKPTPWILLAQSWVYLSGADQFLHLESGTRLSQQAFRTEFNSDCPDTKHRNITAFLTQYNFVEKVQNTVFEPSEPAGIYLRHGRKWVNTYRPSSVTSEGGDAGPFTDFLEYLIPGGVERGHLMKMLAHMVQQPGKKLHHALILGSKEQGIGKSTLLDIMFELLGSHNCRKASSDELESQYNSYIEGTLLVLVEEINLGAGGRKAYNRLKDLITAPTVSMRRLYQDAREVPNTANFIFLTNLDRPLLLDKEDRRFLVLKSPAKPRNAGYYRDFNAWWRGSLGIIKNYLEQVDLSDFDRTAPPPMTEAKQQLIEGSEAPVVQELREMLSERAAPFGVDVVTYRQVADAIQIRLPKASRNAIEDALREIGAKPLGQHRLPKAGTIARFHGTSEKPSLWAVRNPDFWQASASSELVAEYLAHEGRLSDLPNLPAEFGYLPRSLLGPPQDTDPVSDIEGRLHELILINRERSLQSLSA